MSSQKSLSQKSKHSTSKKNVQNELREFYRVAKENPLNLKNEVEIAEQQYIAQKEEAERRSLEYKELLQEKQELDVILKGMTEKLLIADKVNSDFLRQITTLHNEIGAGSNELDWLKTNTNAKVENLKNDVGAIENLKKKQLDSFDERIAKQEEVNNKIRENIAKVEEEIKEKKIQLEEVHSIEGKKNNALIKDTADMTKFLAEL